MVTIEITGHDMYALKELLLDRVIDKRCTASHRDFAKQLLDKLQPIKTLYPNEKVVIVAANEYAKDKSHGWMEPGNVDKIRRLA